VWLEISAVLTSTGLVYNPKLSSKPVSMVCYNGMEEQDHATF